MNNDNFSRNDEQCYGDACVVAISIIVALLIAFGIIQ